MAPAGRVGLEGAGGPGFEIVTRARDAITRYRMLEGGESVVVAVSGGPDSYCLLDVLGRLSTSLALTLVIAHLDHGLGEASREVAEDVERVANEIGTEFFTTRIADLAGPNLHARAREARYRFFEDVAARVGAQRVATGHTLDDQVETLLARLVHGGATSSLASIPPAAGNRIRPLITCRRAETIAYCRTLGIDFYVDPSNDDPRFDRARVRGSLIAEIEKGWGSGAVTAIASATDRLREDAATLSALASALVADIATQDGDRTVIDREALLSAPRALRRRVMELSLPEGRDRSKGIDAALRALDGQAATGARFTVAGGAEIVVQRDSIVIHQPDQRP